MHALLVRSQQLVLLSLHKFPGKWQDHKQYYGRLRERWLEKLNINNPDS